MRFNIKNRETISFKKRYNIGYKLPKMVFGDFSFTLCKSYNIEYIYLYNFKKTLKKYYNFKKSNFKKVWLFLHKNYPLTKKSKNARMGKGKGALARYASRTIHNHNLLEFVGFNLFELKQLKRAFNLKINIPIKIHSNFFLNKSYVYGSKNENFFYFKKYFK
jgi:ribosomal protein L16/L10AE